MIFVKWNEKNDVTFVHYMPFDEKEGLNKTEEELLEEGVLIESIPNPEQVEGKGSEMKYDPESKSVYYEYFDLPVDREKELEKLVEELRGKQELMQSALDDLIMGGGM